MCEYTNFFFVCGIHIIQYGIDYAYNRGDVIIVSSVKIHLR